MRGSVRVLAGVPIRRTIAAERDAALLARAQMYPGCANLHALFAFAALRLLDRLDRVKMRAASASHSCILVALGGPTQLRRDFILRPRERLFRRPNVS